MQTGREIAVGQFRDPRRARDAITALKNAGFPTDDITLLIPVNQEVAAPDDEASQRGAEGRGRGTRGIVAGAVLGGLSGWLAGLRALAVPSVGPFIAAGSVALGAGVGTIAGG